jgi:hypothetical protein
MGQTGTGTAPWYQNVATKYGVQLAVVKQSAYVDGTAVFRGDIDISNLLRALYDGPNAFTSVTVIFPPQSELDPSELSFQKARELRSAIVAAGGSVALRRPGETFAAAVEQRKEYLQTSPAAGKPELPRQLTAQPNTKAFEAYYWSDEERRALLDAYENNDDDSFSVVS